MRTLGNYAPANSAKDWDLIATFFPADDVFRARREAEGLHRTRHEEIGLSYQPFLYALARLWLEEPVVLIETGVRTGVSTFYALSALKHRGPESALYSCDPMYLHPTQAKERVQEALSVPEDLFDPWVFLGQRSADALPRFHQDAPVWDIFTHDSDHREANMTYELDFAWERLREAGFLLVDDFEGQAYGPGDPSHHNGFFEFTKRHQLDWGIVGGAALIQKPA